MYYDVLLCEMIVGIKVVLEVLPSKASDVTNMCFYHVLVIKTRGFLSNNHLLQENEYSQGFGRLENDMRQLIMFMFYAI